MNENDLRIGNYVKSEVNLRKKIKVLQIFTDSYQGDFGDGCRGAIMLSNSEGIPLTEDWLLKFGFRHHVNPYWLSSIDGVIHIATTGNVEIKFFPGDGAVKTQIKLKYVHQLQNLYFALTGEELTINP